MKMTSAQAAKLLRQWNESLKALQRREENTKTFLAVWAAVLSCGIVFPADWSAVEDKSTSGQWSSQIPE